MKSQKVLLVFGILEILSGIMLIITILGTKGGVQEWISVLISFISGLLLIIASKDPSKIMPAWIIALLNVVLSLAGMLITVISNQQGVNIASEVVAVALNLIIFVTANNVKKQNK